MSAILGYTLGAVLVLGSQVTFFRQKIRPLARLEAIPDARQIRETARGMWNYGWPFAVYGIFTWGQAASDRWALQYFRSTADVGLYQVLYQLSYYPVTLASVLLTQLVTPILFARAGDGTDSGRIEQARRMTNIMVAGSVGITLLGVAVMFLVRQPMFSLLVAPEYRTASSLAPAMVFASGVFATGQVAALNQLTRSATRALIAPKAVTACLGTLLNCIGAWEWGIGGVVAGNAAFSILYLLWVLGLDNQGHERPVQTA